MSELWDFSTLLSSFHTKSISGSLGTKYEHLEETMKSQLDQINAQLSSLEGSNINNLPEFDLLCSPIQFPISSPTQCQIDPNKKSEANKLMNTSFQQQYLIQHQEEVKESDMHKIIPPSSVRITPRYYSRTKSKSTLNSDVNLKEETVSQNFTLDSQNKTKLINTRIKLPPLKNSNKNTSSIINKPVFKATPDKICISNFSLSEEYKFRFTLQNVSSHTHGFHVKGPTDPAFSFNIIEKVNTSLIRPGLHITFEITFIPTEPRDYASSLVIISGDIPVNSSENSTISSDVNFYSNNSKNNSNVYQTVVMINCYRDPPKLEVPDVVDLYSTLVHSSKSGSFTITNHGGIAFFCFKSPSGREDSLTFNDGPFTLAPSQFQLAKEESVEITVKFKPRSVGRKSASFEIIPQHFSQRFYFIAQGNSVSPNLKFSICQDNKFLFVPFLPSNIGTSREVEIYNDSDLSFPFHIQILNSRRSSKSILKHLYPDIKAICFNEDNDQDNSLEDFLSNQPFKISPLSGQISPQGIAKISISFFPKFYGFFRVNLVIFVDRIPDITGALESKKMMTISLEAYSGTPDLFIQPQLVIFNSIIPNSVTKEPLDIINNSYLKVKLNFPQNEIVKPANVEPNSLYSELLSQKKKTIELDCFLSKSVQFSIIPIAWKLFQRNPKTAREFIVELRKKITGKNLESDQKINDNERMNTDSESLSCTFSIKPNKNNFFQTAAEVINEENIITNYSTDSMLHNIENSIIKGNARINNNNVNEEFLNDDEMPNIFGLNTINNSLGKINLLVPNEKFMREVTLDLENHQKFNMKFSYLAHINKPDLIVEPPTLDFGFILAGETGNQRLNLINPYNCPIRYQIKINPFGELGDLIKDDESMNDISNENIQNEEEIIIKKCTGIVDSNNNLPIDISLNIKKISKVIRYITIKSWWHISSKNDNGISMPSSEYKVKILACIDRPLLSFENRVVDIGNVYPTLKYNAYFEGKLLNSFPTPFWVDDYSSTATFKRNIDKFRNKNTNLLNDQISNVENRPKSVSQTAKDSQYDDEFISRAKFAQNERSYTVISQHNEETNDNFANSTFFDYKIEIQQSTSTEPKEGNLEIGSDIKLNVSANFAELGDHAFPITINIKGNKYTCAIIAHVAPPKLTLLTEKVDFSDGFIICRRSDSHISIKNECGIASSVRLEVNDDCHKVFQLHDITTHQILPDEIVEFPISCYSEVHGDFYGSFKLIIRDLWQSREVLIPLHVKAHRSFFGFQTHTLGYVKWDANACTNDKIYAIINSYKYGQRSGIEELDFIYFGICSSKLTNAPSLNSLHGKGDKIIRRLYIENYSSEIIFIDWSLVNLVKGRKYAEVSLNIEDDGYVNLMINETEETNLMSPFRILCERTKVKPHERSLVEVVFSIQDKPDIYRGILAAKCGEFTHELGLVAICE